MRETMVHELHARVYWYVFELFDGEPEYSGMDAGKIATAAERAVKECQAKIERGG